jgi:hypothetical protein
MQKVNSMPMQELRRYQVYRLQRTNKHTVMARLRRALKLRLFR